MVIIRKIVACLLEHVWKFAHFDKNAKAWILPKFSWFLRCTIIICVYSLGYSEHSGVLDSVVAPTTAEIWLLEITTHERWLLLVPLKSQLSKEVNFSITSSSSTSPSRSYEYSPTTCNTSDKQSQSCWIHVHVRDSGTCYYASQVTYPTDILTSMSGGVVCWGERGTRWEHLSWLMICVTVFSTYRRAVSYGGHTSNMHNSWHTKGHW